MSKVNSYLQKKDNSLIVLKPIKLYIPKLNFESNLASIEDSNIIAFGIFSFESMDGKDKFDCRFPLRIKLNFFKMESEGDNYIFYYEKDDVIIEQMVFVDNVKEANAFMNLLNGAKISVSSPQELIDAFYGNMNLNKVRIKVPSELIEAMISEMVRWDKDIAIPFSTKVGTPGVKDSDFVLINIKDIPRVTSVFSAISFEDVKKALQASVFMTRTNQLQSIGPIETVLHY